MSQVLDASRRPSGELHLWILYLIGECRTHSVREAYDFYRIIIETHYAVCVDG